MSLFLATQKNETFIAFISGTKKITQLIHRINSIKRQNNVGRLVRLLNSISNKYDIQTGKPAFWLEEIAIMQIYPDYFFALVSCFASSRIQCL